MISNLHGRHEVGSREVSKGTVIHFFVNRALAGKTLTVYEPGTQSRKSVHVKDGTDAFVESAERLVERSREGATGAGKYEIATDEDPGVAVAELVQEIARDEYGIDIDGELVEIPRSGQTMVDEFRVDTAVARKRLG